MAPHLVTTLALDGMTCSSCVSTIETALKAVEGVVSADVSLLASKAIIRHAVSATAETLKTTVEDVGFEADVLSSLPDASSAPPATAAQAFSVVVALEGMTCSSCVSTIESALTALPWVAKAQVSLLAAKGEVLLKADAAGSVLQATEIGQKLCSAVEDVGFGAVLSGVHASQGGLPAGSGGTRTSADAKAQQAAPAVMVAVFTVAPQRVSSAPSLIAAGTATSSSLGVLTSAKMSLEHTLNDRQLGVVAVQVHLGQAATVAPPTLADVFAGKLTVTRVPGLPAVAVVAFEPSKCKPRWLADRLTTAGYAATLVHCDRAAGDAQPSQGSSVLADSDRLLVSLNLSRGGRGGAHGGRAAPGASSDTEAMKARLAAEQQMWTHKLFWCVVFTAPVFILSMIVPYANMKILADWGFVYGVPGLWVRDIILAVLTAPVQFSLAWCFYMKSWKGIRQAVYYYSTLGCLRAKGKRAPRCTLGMDFLIMAGTTTAYAASLLEMGVQATVYQQNMGYANAATTNSTSGGGGHATATPSASFDPGHGGHRLRAVQQTAVAAASTLMHTPVAIARALAPGMDMSGGHAVRKEPAHVFFETSALLITFVVLGKLLETIAKARTGDALSSLLALRPEQAIIVVEDEQEKQWLAASDAAGRPRDGDGHTTAAPDIRVVPLALVSPGDLIKVVPGAAVPCDGVVQDGTSELNESMVTGEALPVPKGPGDEVVGATINAGSGMIRIRATRVGGDSMLSQIVKMVEAAQMSKAPIQAFADKISGVFAPAVLGLSIVVLAAWWGAAATGNVPKDWIPEDVSPFIFSLLFCVAVIVIACPCALGLATPTAVMVGTAVGARNGVLIKGGDALETAHSVNAVLFDKTGTLTEGKPALTDVVILPGAGVRVDSSSAAASAAATPITAPLSISAIMALLATAESGSEHPLARAVVDGAGKIASSQGSGSVQCSLVPDTFQSVPGHGLQAVVEINGSDLGLPDSKAPVQAPVLIGNRGWMEKNGVRVTAAIESQLQRMEKAARTAVIATVFNMPVAVLGIADRVKPEAKAVVTALGNLGIQVWMVTGDHATTAAAVARAVGIPSERVLAQVLPGDKAAKVQQLQAAGRKVAMVGDGVNDSPALAAADVGVAIGAGAQIAVATADVVLLKSDLRDVVVALHLSRAVFYRIWLNFAWALGYNVLGLPLAAGVLYPAIKMRVAPEVAGLAMALSSVSVVLSSLWLKRYKRPVMDVHAAPAVKGLASQGDGSSTGLLAPDSDDVEGAAASAMGEVDLLDLTHVAPTCTCACGNCNGNKLPADVAGWEKEYKRLKSLSSRKITFSPSHCAVGDVTIVEPSVLKVTPPMGKAASTGSIVLSDGGTGGSCCCAAEASGGGAGGCGCGQCGCSS